MTEANDTGEIKELLQTQLMQQFEEEMHRLRAEKQGQTAAEASRRENEYPGRTSAPAPAPTGGAPTPTPVTGAGVPAPISALPPLPGVPVVVPSRPAPPPVSVLPAPILVGRAPTPAPMGGAPTPTPVIGAGAPAPISALPPLPGVPVGVAPSLPVPPPVSVLPAPILAQHQLLREELQRQLQ